MLLLFLEIPNLTHLAEEQTATQTQRESLGSWKPHRCLRKREERISSLRPEPEQEFGGAGYCVFFVVVVVVYFIKFFHFLFLLILMDNIPSCPGLCQVGRHPLPHRLQGVCLGLV